MTRLTRRLTAAFALLGLAAACAPAPRAVDQPLPPNPRKQGAIQPAPQGGAQAVRPGQRVASQSTPGGTRSASAQQTGDKNHPKILAAFGGEYRDPGVVNYVNRIGRRIVATTDQANEKWTFTVLDSPVVNAFAVPGGYVYVTRGLLALANDEAEVAGVVGHEIGHVVANHGIDRRNRSAVAQGGALLATLAAAVVGGAEVGRAVGQLSAIAGQGYVASYSRQQEFEADRIGVRYLSAAGYDPFAQADFLGSMRAQADLSAKLQGRSYNPNTVSFLASHPANDDRIRQAIAEAGRSAPAAADRGRRAHLRAIDGMVYGDSRKQGFVRGRVFAHPELGFIFEAPEGYTIVNSARRVAARGPAGARLIFDGDERYSGRMSDYVSRVWAREIGGRGRPPRLYGLREVRINGLNAAVAIAEVQVQGRPYDAHLTAYRLDNRIYRIVGLAPRGDRRAAADLDDARYSFRRLQGAEARGYRPYRVRVTSARGGSVASYAARMPPAPLNEDRFRVLNGLTRGEQPRAGQSVKLIVE